MTKVWLGEWRRMCVFDLSPAGEAGSLDKPQVVEGNDIGRLFGEVTTDRTRSDQHLATVFGRAPLASIAYWGR